MCREGGRLAHLTTVDSSLAILLGTELAVDLEHGWHVVGISAPGPFTGELERSGVRHVAVPAFTRAWDPVRDLRAVLQLWRVLRRLELDVLHTHTPKASVLGRVVGRLAGVPVVVNTCHGLWAQPNDPWLRRFAVYTVEALAARFSDYELYQNNVDRRTLAWAVPGNRARTVGNGIDLRRFRPDPEGRRAVRSELGVRDDGLLVAGVGRRVLEKGLDDFITMAECLGGRARCVWVGPADPEKPDRLTRRSDAVTFLGMRRDMPAVYSAMDVFVLPSHREGLSRSSMEAAACGTALVLSDIRGCREIGRDGSEVLLVPPHDPVSLTRTVGRLLEEPATRRRLAEAARARALREFDQRRVAERSLETYGQVARRKGLGWWNGSSTSPTL